ncbi:hypothetical protein H7K45_25700 [Mycobacterium yunnanensis]|uniref:Uncharacterized protein n=1 Tax=Mycobacterium yunnanensis TaxID=368477 RepID=A0A9X3C4W3_9MYCO|nr:hypothetical protein [Mycobacterium yunnanensis]MCV7423952.1 hypothetical protein [Mycobacterium yunnanensis]
MNNEFSAMTPRDHLLEALIRWHLAASEFESERLQFSSVSGKTAAAVAEGLKVMVQAGEMVRSDDAEVARAVGYGIPNWLIPNDASGGHGPLDLATGVGSDALWAAEGDGGAPILGEDDLELAIALVEALSQTSSTTLLENAARLGPDDYDNLARALVHRGAELTASTGALRGDVRSELKDVLSHSGELTVYERELASRLFRVDVPTLFDGRYGLVTGLSVTLGQASGVRSECIHDDVDQPKLHKVFRDAITEGHYAALMLLRNLGVETSRVDLVSRLEYRIVGTAALPDLDQRSVGLPIALYVLERALGLPPLDCAVTGALSREGRIEEMDANSTRLKLAAVRADGFRQRLAARTSIPAGEVGFWQIAATTLRGAAAALWREDWLAVEVTGARGQLESIGVTVSDGYDPDPFALIDDDGVRIGVRSAYHDEVMDFLTSYPSMPMILGGPPGVGKSWTARSVANAMSERGHAVRLVRFEDGTLPEKSALLRIMGLVLTVLPIEPNQPWLLIAEGIDASEEDADLAESIVGVAELGCSVLVLNTTKRASTKRLNQQSIQVLRFRYDYKTMEGLVDRLIEEFPIRFSKAKGYAGILARACAGDLWWMIRLLDFVCQSGPFGDPDSLKAAFLEMRGDGLDDAAMQAAKALAAYSAIGVAAPTIDLLPLTENQLRRLGAREVAESRWLLPSPAAMASLLNERRSWADQVFEALNGPLARLLREEDVESILTMLRGTALINDAEILDKLVRTNRERLLQVMCAGDVATQKLARALSLMSAPLHQVDRGRLALQIFTRLNGYGWRGLTVAGATSVVQLLDKNDNFVVHDVDEPDAHWQRAFRRLEDDISTVAHGASPSHAMGLIRALDRTGRWDLTKKIITHLCRVSLRESRGDSGDDRFAALSIIELTRRMDRRRGPGDDPLESVVVSSKSFRTLVKTAPSGGDAYDFLAHLALTTAIGEGEITPKEVELQLAHRIPRTHAMRLASGLMLLRKHAPSRMRDVRRADIGSAIEGIVPATPPIAMGHLIHTLNKLSPRLAIALHYDATGAPKIEVLNRFVTALATGDHRSAGILLQACANLDIEFNAGGDRFSVALANRLAPLWDTLHTEPRTSVVENVLRALALADLDNFHLVRIAGPLLDKIVEQFKSNFADAGIARLAWLLCEDDNLGETFVEMMSGRIRAGDIDERELSTRMRAVNEPNAMAAYQRLATAVAPELCVSFSKDFAKVRLGAGTSRSWSVVDLLEAVQACTATLGYGGHATPGPKLLRRVAPNGREWGSRLGQAKRAEELSQAIDIFRKIDPVLAEAALNNLHAARDGTQAAHAIVRMINDRSASHAYGLQLLASVSKANPRLSAAVVDRLNKQPVWTNRRWWLVDSDHPVEQGETLRNLAVVGMHLTRKDEDLLRNAWTSPPGASVISMMRSPWSVHKLLFGLQALKPRLAAEFATHLDGPGLVRRLRNGWARDAPAIAPLLIALDQAGRDDIATDIAVMLCEQDPPRLSPWQAGRLVSVMRHLDASKGRLMADSYIDRGPIALVTRGRLTQPNEYLLGIGWLAWQLRKSGCAVPTIELSEPRVAENPIARLWAEVATGAVSRNDAVERVVRLSTLLAPFSSWTGAACLLLGSTLGVTDQLVEVEFDFERAFASNSEWLVEILDAARRDHVLDEFVEENIESVERAARSILSTSTLHPVELSHLLEQRRRRYTGS